MKRQNDQKLHGIKEKFNYLRYLWELNHPKTTLASPPPLVTIEPTTLCNLKCTYCATGTMTREKRHMEIEMFESIIKKLEGQTRVIYLGDAGEPLTNPKICDFINIASEAGLYVVLFTNATRLNPKRVISILESGLNVIEFSVDSIHKETYESIRLNGRAPKVWKNVLRFLQLKKEMNSPIITRMRVVKSESNQHLIDREIKILDTLPFDEIRISNYLNNKGWEDALEYHDGRNSPNALWCIMPWKEPGFGVDGTVRCPVDFNHAYNYANIEDGSLMDAWNSPNLVKLRAAFLSGDLEQLKQVNDICWRCNCRTKYGYNNATDGLVQAILKYGIDFPDYYFGYLNFSRSPEEEASLESKYANFDESVRKFEAYAGYKVTPLKKEPRQAIPVTA